MKARTSPSRKGRAPSRLTDSKIKGRGDWQVKMLSQLRALIEEADPAAVEEVKWRKPTNPKGVPVWSHDGIICTGGILKDAVRLTFLKGAQLKDPEKLFNASLKGNALRAIDFHNGDAVDETSLKALVLEAVALNVSKMRERSGL
jgi:hypothetical protein